MQDVQWIAEIADLGLTGILLLVLWQGLVRFDKLLSVVIHLALLNHSDAVTREGAREALSKMAERQ